MKNKVVISRNWFIVLVCGCLFSLVTTFDFAMQVAAKESTDSDTYKELKVFTDVLALIQKNYVEVVDVKELVEGALKGMLLTLDPHSSYLNEETYNELKVETKGEFGGLGIEITVKDGLLTVVAAIEDSPAYKAGVEAGDQIVKIGDEFAKNLSMVDAVKKMRGPKGTPVQITVHRKDKKELIPITITRDVIKVKSVRSRPLEDRFGYIRLVQFQEESTDEFEKALTTLTSQMKDKKIHGLILDLRNNPGGLLNQATRISDIFLKDNVIVYTDGRLESQKQKYYAHDDGDEPDYPLIVLVNGGSASASEIVSGALQDAGRAVILGTQSFGKGSVQTILPMENGGALRLTTALYYTKSGRSIQAQGITPDVIVPDKRLPDDSDEAAEEDETGPRKERDLPGALKNPNQKDKDKTDAAPEEKPVAPQSPEPQKESKDRQPTKDKKGEEHIAPGSRQAMTADLGKLLKDDPQLDEALKLLKTWHVFQGKPGQPGGAVEAQAQPAPQS
ncbi:MAG: S41 family peptidase [Bdellovibrionota bacterium]